MYIEIFKFILVHERQTTFDNKKNTYDTIESLIHIYEFVKWSLEKKILATFTTLNSSMYGFGHKGITM